MINNCFEEYEAELCGGVIVYEQIFLARWLAVVQMLISEMQLLNQQPESSRKNCGEGKSYRILPRRERSLHLDYPTAFRPNALQVEL